LPEFRRCLQYRLRHRRRAEPAARRLCCDERAAVRCRSRAQESRREPVRGYAGRGGHMNGRKYFPILARYHRWAYGRLYERIDELGDADYHADRGLFFRSIHGSLNHLLLVDRLWLQRLEGQVTG